MTDPLRTIIVDDHPHARLAIRELLATEQEIQIVAEGMTGGEAVALAAAHMPDLMLIDIDMPELDGLEATRRIKEAFPHIKIIIITVSDDVAHLFEALKKGAQGYILKHLQPSAWRASLRAFIHDDQQLSKELALQMLQQFGDFQTHHAPSEVAPLERLTAREQEVLQYVVKGCSNREIAHRLFITENTVKNHLKSIMHKLHADNRTQLTKYVLAKK